jgi:prepilin-type N-terminal cleavage/methylation domain-containing protein/prepilin-type processing-associated H-X9-DG protein
MQPKNAACRRGFTLMELLVVVAIIAVLIAFLLPALSEARRSANKVKCLAALRDIHNAFNMYAVEFQQAWPVVQHVAVDSAGSPTGPGVPILPAYTSTPEPRGGERHWADLIAKYAGHQKVTMTYYKDLAQLKTRKSVIWGCPEWENNVIWTGAAGEAYSPGYGMSFNANPQMYINLLTASPPGPGSALVYESMAWISMRNSAIRGSYAKTNVWGKRSADKLLLADSQYYFVAASVPAPNNKVPTGTSGEFGCTFDGYQGSPKYASGPDPDWNNMKPGGASFKHFYIDGGRHAKSGQSQLKLANMAGTNVLFADGHAATVTVREAYVALIFPGQKP